MCIVFELWNKILEDLKRRVWSVGWGGGVHCIENAVYTSNWLNSIRMCILLEMQLHKNFVGEGGECERMEFTKLL